MSIRDEVQRYNAATPAQRKLVLAKLDTLPMKDGGGYSAKQWGEVINEILPPEDEF